MLKLSDLTKHVIKRWNVPKNKGGKPAGRTNPYNYSKFIAHNEINVSKLRLISERITTSSLAPVGESLMCGRVLR